MGVRPLIKVDREDSGVYICSLGEKIKNLESEDKMPVIYGGSSVSQCIGQPASLECRVSGRSKDDNCYPF